MENDLLLKSIIKLEVDDLTPEIVASYDMMAKHENFKPYHKEINAKLKEYNKANGVSVETVKEFKLVPENGDFYKTVNGTLVMIWVYTTELIEFVIVIPKPKLTPKQVGIAGSKLTDLNLLHMSMKGGRYQTNYKGQMLGLLSVSDGFPLNIKTKVKASFTELKELAKV